MDYSRQHFEQLYKANYRQMYLAAFALAGDADDAKDIVSQVFTQLWQTKPQVAEDRLTAYLLVSVRNQWQHMFRQRDNWQQLREELSHADPEGEDDNVRNELLDELSAADKRLLKFGKDFEAKFQAFYAILRIF